MSTDNPYSVLLLEAKTMSILDKTKPVKLPAIPRTDRQLKDYLKALLCYFPADIRITSAKLTTAQSLGGTCRWLGGNKVQIRISQNFDSRLGFLATALHELSHGYEFVVFGESNHGKRFMAINNNAIAVMGLSDVITAARCHSEDLRHKTAPRVSVKQPQKYQPTSAFLAWCKGNGYGLQYSAITIRTYQALTGKQARKL